MRFDLSRALVLLPTFYFADLASALLSLTLGIPHPLTSNWAFVLLLASSHFISSIVCTYGMGDRKAATISAISFAALAYVLFCGVSIGLESLASSLAPLASLELGALAGAMVLRSAGPRATSQVASDASPSR